VGEINFAFGVERWVRIFELFRFFGGTFRDFFLAEDLEICSR